MWLTHSFQRYLCVLFLTSAIITSLFVMKNSGKVSEDNHYLNRTKMTKNEILQTFSSSSQLLPRGNRSGDIYILGLFELTTKWGERREGLSEVAAAQLAVRHVNSFKVLPDYQFKLIINDTKCDPGVGIDRFFHAVYSKKAIVMLLGTSCSNVTETLAHVVRYWDVIQISFGSISPTLSDRKKFPSFFRTVAPDSSHNAAKVKFVRHFNWTVIATFCQSENEFLLPLNDLITDFEEANVTCVTTITFSFDNYKEQLKVLKESDIRIIVAALSTNIASRVFCEAYRLGMYGGDYVWILQDREELWWSSTEECVSVELSRAVDGLILISAYNFVPRNTSISGLDNSQFQRALNVPKEHISKYASLTYDAVWAMALGLREVNMILEYEFNYMRNDVICKFVEAMGSLHFMGISGPVRFTGADRVGSSVIRQLQGENVVSGNVDEPLKISDGHVRDIAIFDSDTCELNFECKSCRPVNWRNRQTPIAQRILKVSLVTIPKPLFYSIMLVSVAGILLSIFFLYFNLHFRRLKSVKLSSPKLNNVAVVGCILVYISVILVNFDIFTMNEYVDGLCTVRVYLLSSGFSLAFGSMFAKTYRVHRIFTYCGGSSKVKDKLLKDKQLIALILIPLIIDAIILALWVMIDPLERQLYNLTLQTNFEDRGVVYQPQVQVCRSQNTSGWFVAIYGYKGLILIMGVFMAWETRHVKVPALNDSQYIGICVYSAVFSAIVTILTSFTDEYVVLSYLARTMTILTSTTLTSFLLFFPKFKSVFGRRNSQDQIMQSMGLKMEYNTRRFIINDPKEQVLRLEIQNKVYKCELAALDLEIARLEGLLHANRRSNEGGIFTIFRGDSRMPAANVRKVFCTSWPTHFSGSQRDLNSGRRALSEIKYISSESNRSLNDTTAFVLNDFSELDIGEQKRKPNPEFYTERSFSKTKRLSRAKSELDVIFARSFD